jgi:amino acid transporter
LVGFESATALSAESQSPKHITRGVILSLVIQGLIFYMFEYFGAIAWLNSNYGIDAAAKSGAPIGDMVKNLGDVLLGGNGFLLMIVIAITVAIAVIGTTLACMNTGVRVTYAMSKDNEMPSVLGMLSKHATPHTGVWVITIASAIIGAFGVLSVNNLTAITFLSNIGTFLLYGMTCLVTLVAFLRHPSRNNILHTLVPILGVLANLGMLAAVIYLGIAGGGDTADAALYSLYGTGVWTVLGLGYLAYNSFKNTKSLLAK